MDGCFECGSSENLHGHHVVPQSRGGTKAVPLCPSCHATAHGKSGDFDISSLTSQAMQAKADRGEYTGGKVPFGYMVDEGDGDAPAVLVENPEEQQILDEIHQLREEGLSLRKVADELNRRGVARRNGNEWHHVAVSRVLKDAA